LPWTTRQFGRAIVMPNLKPPVTTTALALAYRERIMAALPADSTFAPLMTLYLTDNTPTDEIDRAVESEHVHAIKLYPAGATTNADAGVTDLKRCQKTLERMSELGLPLLIHGEVTDADVDVFDREAKFIDQVLQPLLDRLPELKVVFEHITTTEAAQFVSAGPDNLAATVTPQHLLHDRNALFAGGLRPHMYCLPVLKRGGHRQAILQAVTGPARHKFFLGTDSAPHTENAKLSDCGCAGIFNAPTALELYVTAFESVNALDKFADFASRNGPAFYGLPINSTEVLIERQDWIVPEAIELNSTQESGPKLIPMHAGQTLRWKLISSTSAKGYGH